MGASILQPQTNAVTPNDPDQAASLVRVYQRLAEMQSQLDDLLRNQRVNYAGTQEGWNAVGFSAGWANYASAPPYSPAAYFKDPSGFVHLRGAVSNPSVTNGVYTTVFTLPAGYRPEYRHAPVVAVQNPSGLTLGQVVVFQDGQLQIAVAFTGAVTYAVFDNIVFKAV